MAEHPGMHEAIHEAIHGTVPPGTLTYERDTTTTPMTVQPAPTPPAKADAHNLNLDSVVFYLGALMLIGGIFAGVNKWLRDRRKEDREWIAEQIGSVREQLDDRLTDVEEAAKTFKTKDQLAEDRAAIEGQINTLKHAHSNELTKQSGRIHRLEQGRVEDIARIVRIETKYESIEKGQVEIKTEMRDGFRDLPKAILEAVHSRLEVTDQQIKNIVDSVREVREVKPKP